MEQAHSDQWADISGEPLDLSARSDDPKNSLRVLDNVLRLAQAAKDRSHELQYDRATDRDWSRTLNLVGQAAAVIRAAESRVHEMKIQNQRLADELKAAEARAIAAEVRAQEAQDRAGEAQEWLKRIHDALEQLTIAKFGDQRSPADPKSGRG